MAHVGVNHTDIVAFVGAHPVGDCIQTAKASHRPQGWAPTKSHPLIVVHYLKDRINGFGTDILLMPQKKRRAEAARRHEVANFCT
jgi:hypothetical protein